MMDAPTSSQFRRRSLLIGAAALPIALLQSPRHVSAWQGMAGATLLASGEAGRAAAAPMAWQVVRDVAEVGPAAVFEQRALGFAVASGLFTPLMLTDETTASQTRLEPGEAALVGGGKSQRIASLGKSPQAFLRLELVPAARAGDAGGDHLLFAGPVFDAPGGPVTLALSRAELDDGDSLGLPPGAGETLLLVEQGAVDLEVGEAAPRERLQTTVGSDTAYAARTVASAATLYGARDATSVLIAAFA
jgi:hypothetical protein